jgi:hypothetical protein
LFSPDALALVLAGAAAIILGMCFVAAIGDRRTNDKLQRQKLCLMPRSRTCLRGCACSTPAAASSSSMTATRN